MGTFVEKYVRVPLREIESTYKIKELQPIYIVSTETEIQVQIGNDKFSLSRTDQKHNYGNGTEQPELEMY